MGSTLDNAQDFLNRERIGIIKKVRAAAKRHKKSKESKLERNACADAEALGCLHYKLDSPGRRGKRDRVFALPSGRTWWVEFKREGEKSRRNQDCEQGRLVALGHIAEVFDDLSAFSLRLRHLLGRKP